MSSSEKTMNYASVTPYLSIKDADKAIEFYEKVLGAKQTSRLDRPDGKIMHATIQIGDSTIMLAESCDQMKGANELGGSPVSLYVYLDDVDGVYKKAIAAGAKSTMEPTDMFYGDRFGGFRDPFGHIWSVAKHIEDVSEDEIKRRAAELFKNQKAA